jgi:hypothetical protein
MRTILQPYAKKRGATITIVALSTAAILAMGAITVDMGMLYKMRLDAQRTADAAALAGASAYLEYPAVQAKDSAYARAWRYIAANYIGGRGINTTKATDAPVPVRGSYSEWRATEAKVEFAPDIYRVRVTVWRPQAPSFLGRILGVTGTRIQAYAAAEATDAGGAKCVKPFALADIWNETTAGSDADGNRFWDTDENWEYGPGDTYGPWDGEETDVLGEPQETGYGSSWRDGNGQGYLRDRGRQLVIKPQDPQQNNVIRPGHFFAWDMPDDPDNGVSNGCPAGGGNGAQDFEHSICSCNDAEIYTDTEYDLKPGNMVGPTKQGITNLMKQDPGAKWSPTADGGKGAVTGSKYSNWRDSPRVIKVALYDPAEEYKSGRISIKFNNIALMFVEDYTRPKGQAEDAIVGRFITFAQGSATPGPGGPLAKVLRLVE